MKSFWEEKVFLRVRAADMSVPGSSLDRSAGMLHPEQPCAGCGPEGMLSSGLRQLSAFLSLPCQHFLGGLLTPGSDLASSLCVWAMLPSVHRREQNARRPPLGDIGDGCRAS